MGLFGIFLYLVALVVVAIGLFLSPLGDMAVPMARGLVPAKHLFEKWNYLEKNIPNLKGKTFLVTGANSGIGLSSSAMLAEHGATVVMVRFLFPGKFVYIYIYYSSFCLR
jgi:cytochrome c oxidase assembly factor CtaG